MKNTAMAAHRSNTWIAARCAALRTLALALLPTWAAAQTPPLPPLNDTGQTLCYDGSAMVACSVGNTGNAADYPGQDARFGRDAANPPKNPNSGGAAGFDFTKVCNSGEAAGQGSCPAIPTYGTGANQWGCVRDNVTNLMWEVKQADSTSQLRHQDHRYTWGNTANTTTPSTCGGTLATCNSDAYVAAVNAAGLCGQTSGWRLPTERELLSIVHYGASNPAIDTAYFPNTPSYYYWTSDQYPPAPAYAWVVSFYNGDSGGIGKASANHVRLVRSGQ